MDYFPDGKGYIHKPNLNKKVQYNKVGFYLHIANSFQNYFDDNQTNEQPLSLNLKFETYPRVDGHIKGMGIHQL